MQDPIEDLFEDFDLIADFPWTEGSFAELGRYFQVVRDFLPHSTAQRAVRLRARLNAATDPIDAAEFESELEEVESDANTVLPRLVWGGALVAVYGTLEFGIKRTLEHWQKTVSSPTVFKKKRKESFLVSAEAYAETHMKLNLFPDQAHRASLLHLGALRNSFAHSGGLLVDLSEELTKAIVAKAHPGVDLEILDDQWVANESAVLCLLHLSKRTLNQFGNEVLEQCFDYNRASPGDV